MTSAQTFSGIGDRSSSRVLAPPGGGSSISFGGYEAPAPSNAGGRRRQPEQENNRDAINRMPPQQQQRQQQAESPMKNYGQGVMQQQNNAYGGGNGSGLHDGRSSTRLHAPPGGQSSMASLLSGGASDMPAQRGGRGQAREAPFATGEPAAPSQSYGRGGRRDPNASSDIFGARSQPAAQQPSPAKQPPGGRSSFNPITGV